MVAIGLGKYNNFPRNFITAHVLKILCGVQQKKKHDIFGTEFTLSSVPCYYDVDVGLLNYWKYVWFSFYKLAKAFGIFFSPSDFKTDQFNLINGFFYGFLSFSFCCVQKKKARSLISL